MSRIGKPDFTSGVTVTLGEDNTITVKGPKGTLNQKLNPEMLIKVDCYGVPPHHEKKHKFHGLTRSLIYNMVFGVTGYTRSLRLTAWVIAPRSRASSLS